MPFTLSAFLINIMILAKYLIKKSNQREYLDVVEMLMVMNYNNKIITLKLIA